jgi:predicted enzyme related to lactoylglutathione lyase
MKEMSVSQRDDYEPGVPCWVDTLQPDPRAAMAFYAGVFGWDFAGPGPMPGDSPGGYFVARMRGRDVAGVGGQPAAEGTSAPSWNTHVFVESAADAAARAQGAGGSVLVEPFDALPAGRMAVLADPTGAAFCVWEPAERRGAQLVSEPGAWAMSHLQTPDPEPAVAFYGALFGWTTETFGEGEGAVTMFRLPGYVGGEPDQPVSREVVATMGAGGEASPAQWTANFWVHDVDAAAAKAAELGGTALVPPFDTPIARTAVLADPHGASFAINNVPGGEKRAPQSTATGVK